MNPEPVLRLLASDELSCAVRALITDWRFMAQHGWTKEAYIKRYGTSANPKMGDGGPLIWQADVFAHHRARQLVYHMVSQHPVRYCYSSKRYHRIGYKLATFIHSSREEERWNAILEQARKVKDRQQAIAT